MQECYKCEKKKEISCFKVTSTYRNKSGELIRYRRSECKECERLGREHYRASKPDLVKAINRKSQYNLSAEGYEALLQEQDNKCAICSCEFITCPQIDHDHLCCSKKKSCGKCIRGLLCFRCNAALGGFKDKIGLLKSAIEYLESFQRKG